MKSRIKTIVQFTISAIDGVLFFGSMKDMNFGKCPWRAATKASRAVVKELLRTVLKAAQMTPSMMKVLMATNVSLVIPERLVSVVCLSGNEWIDILDDDSTLLSF